MKENKTKGFSLIEMVVVVAIFSFILFVVTASLFSVQKSGDAANSSREVQDNIGRAIDEISHEIRSAKGIYDPTTTATQLSLETTEHLPLGQENTFIDFFLCGPLGSRSVCFKQEGQDAVALTSGSVNVANLSFSQITTGTQSSVKIDITVNSASSSASLTSTVSLRSYSQ